MPRPDVPGVHHRFVDAAGVRLHLAEAGAEKAPIVLMLHGFPEFWYSWRQQLTGLADAGLRAIAIDLRGYGESDKPAPLPANYNLVTLAGDILALVRALGQERGDPDLRVCLVGHDWGGALAWAVAALHPECLSHLVILNAPHPVGFRRSLLRHPSQLVKSWYIAMFQVPGLAERRIGTPRAHCPQCRLTPSGQASLHSPMMTLTTALALDASQPLVAELCLPVCLGAERAFCH